MKEYIVQKYSLVVDEYHVKAGNRAEAVRKVLGDDRKGVNGPIEVDTIEIVRGYGMRLDPEKDQDLIDVFKEDGLIDERGGMLFAATVRSVEEAE